MGKYDVGDRNLERFLANGIKITEGFRRNTPDHGHVILSIITKVNDAVRRKNISTDRSAIADDHCVTCEENIARSRNLVEIIENRPCASESFDRLTGVILKHGDNFARREQAKGFHG